MCFEVIHNNIKNKTYVGFEVLSAVVIKGSIFTIEESAEQETSMKQLAISGLAYSSILKMEVTFSSETLVVFSGLHGIVSKKM
jgi:DUF917 family protein